MGDPSNFDDGRAERKPGYGAEPVWDANHWNVYGDSASPQNTEDMNPREWIGLVVTLPPVPPTPTSSPTVAPCVSIQEIQGNGESTPLEGSKVKVCNGFITSKVRNGFYIQEVPLLDSSYSSGIFVFTTADISGLSVGDNVIVSGTATEVSIYLSFSFSQNVYGNL